MSESDPGSAHRSLVARIVREARALAERGELAAGDECLTAGLRHAGHLLREDRPGAVELLLRFHHALTLYSTRYGVCLEPHGPFPPLVGTPSPGVALWES